MRKTFEEKYNEKLKDKVSGVEFSEASLNETIHDIKNGVDNLSDIVNCDCGWKTPNEAFKQMNDEYEENFGKISDNLEIYK